MRASRLPRLAPALLLALSACTANLPTVPDGGAQGAGAGAGAGSATNANHAAATLPANGNLASSANATTGVPAGSGARVAGNPFAGAVLYAPTDYGAEVGAGGAAALPTAVWLDRIAAIAGGAGNGNRLSLAGHLDAAVAQGQAASKPAAVVLVVYDLPGRDCKSQASNGELQGTAGLATYKAQFIDAIAQTLTSKAVYGALRIVLVIEPDSLPNMVTNAATIPACQAVASQNLYTDGIAYALNAFKGIQNVYMYLDIAHSGWLGWPQQMGEAVALYAKMIGAAGGAGGAIRGLATNTANYTPTQELGVNPNNQAVLAGTFYQYNPCFDELTYVRALAAGFGAAGLGSLGFIIDTSRNGWPPSAAPGQPQDRRLARGNWCNIKGTGLGARPQVSPGLDPLIDAFLYVKPPGESDGFSTLQNPSNAPDAQGKRFDPDCDPTNPSHADSMPGAPAAGVFFPSNYSMLVSGAQPAL